MESEEIHLLLDVVFMGSFDESFFSEITLREEMLGTVI